MAAGAETKALAGAGTPLAGRRRYGRMPLGRWLSAAGAVKTQEESSRFLSCSSLDQNTSNHFQRYTHVETYIYKHHPRLKTSNPKLERWKPRRREEEQGEKLTTTEDF